MTINTDPYTAGTATFTVTGTNLTGDINLAIYGNGFAINPTTITAANAANGVPVTVTYSAQEAGTYILKVIIPSGVVTKQIIKN